SFERLYRMYAPVVIGWLALRVEPYAVDDLLQDVWTVFYGRWRSWQQPAETRHAGSPSRSEFPLSDGPSRNESPPPGQARTRADRRTRSDRRQDDARAPD